MAARRHQRLVDLSMLLPVFREGRKTGKEGNQGRKENREGKSFPDFFSSLFSA